jgi:hypothetical protein
MIVTPFQKLPFLLERVGVRGKIGVVPWIALTLALSRWERG